LGVARSALSEEDIRLLEGKNFAQVATLGPDGWPSVTTVWVDHADGMILINTAMGRKKHRNLSKDPRVSIAVNDATNPYKATFIRGKVIETIEGKDAEDHIHKMSKKYTGREKFPLAPGERRILYKIQPLRVKHWPPS
jgi:PPOX class probable F420-dependent enzyme